MLQVTWALQALVKQQGWSGLPMYALGASSGGAMVLLLALTMPLQVTAHVCSGHAFNVLATGELVTPASVC